MIVPKMCVITIFDAYEEMHSGTKTIQKFTHTEKRMLFREKRFMDEKKQDLANAKNHFHNQDYLHFKWNKTNKCTKQARTFKNSREKINKKQTHIFALLFCSLFSSSRALRLRIK